MDQVMTKYAKLLWSIAGAVLKNAASRQDIEECVADVFIYLWQHPEQYDPRRGRLKVWLSVVARSQAIDRYRRLARQQTVPLEEALLAAQPEVVDGLLAADARRALAAAVETLEEPDREILVRRYYYSQKPREIAAALGIPAKQVQNRLYRAKQKLRETMAQ